MTKGWFAAWRCECSDIELTKEEIPDLCPNHGEPLMVGHGDQRRQYVEGFMSGLGVKTRDEVLADD